MNPWTIIGWIVLALISIPVLLLVIKGILTAVDIGMHRVDHWRTRGDKPEAGQVWKDRTGDLRVKIDRVVPDTGNVVIRSGNVSFGNSPEDWKQYVRNRALRRVL